MTTWTDDELSRIGRARPLLICSRSASAIVSHGRLVHAEMSPPHSPLK